MSQNYNFQIDLQSIIDLLSHNLYSTPEVFLRELLQNGVDAISARLRQQPEHVGQIEMEIVAGEDNEAPTLVFSDNGIGLTESEVHQFLATIGNSSKRDRLERGEDFLGQFGIGLLSCFVVSEEIVVVTQSIQPAAPAVEWRGRSDGTYSLKTLSPSRQPGTQIYLRSKADYREYFEGDRIAKLAQHYGGILPHPIALNRNGSRQIINAEPPIWEQAFATDDERRTAILAYGQETFGEKFFDYISIASPVGGVKGIAFVLPYSQSLAAKPAHRVYLKRMLLSEKVEGILPDWAFFVKCVVNVNGLRPIASREGFYENTELMATQGALGQSLKRYLVELAERDRPRLQQFIALHQLAVKALAVHDDEFYRLIVDWLPFETSLGRVFLGDYRQQFETVRYVPTCDQFSQITRVAASQNLCIINGGYVYDAEILEKLPEAFDSLLVETLDASTLTGEFEDLTLEEREKAFRFIQLSDVVLQPFKCSTQLKKFLPTELPTLYSINKAGDWHRSVAQTQEISGDTWSTMLSSLDPTPSNQTYAQLCFNFNNPLIQRLMTLDDKPLLERALQMLYVQALLLGRHPLSAAEMKLLNEGLLGLIDLGIQARPSSPAP